MAGRPRKGFNVLGKKRRSELHQMENLKEEEIGQPVIGDDGHQIVGGGNQRAGSDGGIDMNVPTRLESTMESTSAAPAHPEMHRA